MVPFSSSELKTPTVLFCALVLLADLVSAESNNYLIWNNNRGQTPCDLAASLCSSSAPSSLNASSPSAPDPTICTCCSVFFNIWSACKLLKAQIPPNWSLWQGACSKDSVTPQIGFPESLRDGSDIPNWAQISIPDDTNVFDVTEAIRVADGNTHKWTTVQIVLPVVIGTGILFVIASIAFFWCRRVRAKGKATTNSPPAPPSSQKSSVLSRIRQFLSFSRAGNVEKINPRKNWKIDPWITETEDEREQLNSKTTAPAFVELLYSDGDRTSTSHTKDISPPETPNKNTFWKQIQPFDHLENLAQLVRLPWKPGPRKVQAGPRGSRFRMDDIETSTHSSMSRRATLQSTRFDASIWSARSGPSEMIREDESGDGEAGPGPLRRNWSKWNKVGERQADPERMTLLSVEEKSALLVGNPPSSDRTHLGVRPDINVRVIGATPFSSVRSSDSPNPPPPESPTQGPYTIRIQKPPATPPRNQMQLQDSPSPVVEGLNGPSRTPEQNVVPPQPSSGSQHRPTPGQSTIFPSDNGQNSSSWLSANYSSSSLLRTSSTHLFTKTTPPPPSLPTYQRQPSLVSLVAASMRNRSGKLIDEQQQLQPRRRVFSDNSLNMPSSSSPNLPLSPPAYVVQSNIAKFAQPSRTSLTNPYGGTLSTVGSQARLDLRTAHQHTQQGSLRTDHRSASSDMLLPRHTAAVMLFPGSVRGAGYMVNQ